MIDLLFLILEIKKGRQLFAHCDQSTVSFSVFDFCVQVDRLDLISFL